MRKEEGLGVKAPSTTLKTKRLPMFSGQGSNDPSPSQGSEERDEQERQRNVHSINRQGDFSNPSSLAPDDRAAAAAVCA
jgi:hypothetical protein